MRNIPPKIELDISEYSSKGDGIGQFKGPAEAVRKVKVPFAMVGDKVIASKRGKRKGLIQGHLEQILEPSPLRIAPRCIHFGVCGGCRWQHIPYDEQTSLKESFVKKCFQELLNDNIQFHSILKCEEPWHYRNKMEFTFSNDASQRKYLGLIIDSSRGKVLNLTECHLVNPWFVQTLNAVRQWWDEVDLEAYHSHTDRGSLRTLTLREGMRTGDRLVMLTVSGNPDYALLKRHLEMFVSFVRDAAEPNLPGSRLSIFLRIQQIAKGMPTNFYEMLLHGPDHIREILHIQIQPHLPAAPLTFSISPTAFFQPNTLKAEQLYTRAIQLAGVSPQSVVYDLYCGTGTLGLCLAKHVKQVIGIEISPESAENARTNAKNNHADNVTIISGAVRHVLTQIKNEKTLPLPDLVIVDPPRVGLETESIKNLVELNPAKILYISCNPATQAENIKELHKYGYELTLLQPVDQFPHTFHIENIAILTRKDS